MERLGINKNISQINEKSTCGKWHINRAHNINGVKILSSSLTSGF